MNPGYSRNECVAAMRDYCEFLVKMYMDPSNIKKAPQDGWPIITPETAKGLKKTKEVVSLLRHLPYIACKEYYNVPEGLPGSHFKYWDYTIAKLAAGEFHLENEIEDSQGLEGQFGGRIPSRYIGLVHGGHLLGIEHPDVILLDTWWGVIHWMACPAKVLESALPRPSSEVESKGAIDVQKDSSVDGDEKDDE